MLIVHQLALAERYLFLFDIKAIKEKLCNSFHMVCRKVCVTLFLVVFLSISNLYWYLQLSIDIGTEVRYQNKMIDEMVSFTFILKENNALLLNCRNTVEKG